MSVKRIALLGLLACAVPAALAQTGGRAPGTGASTPSMSLSTGSGRLEINPIDRPLGSGLGPILPSYGSSFGTRLGEPPLGMGAPAPAGPLAPTIPGESASSGASAPATTVPLPSVGIPGGSPSGLPGTTTVNPGTR